MLSVKDLPITHQTNALTIDPIEEPGNFCPACGGANPKEAVFCTHSPCDKALGEFRYVREELRSEARWHETLAEKVVGFIGKPQFLGAHILWFSAWILINTGILAMGLRFDSYPFALLGIILAMEAIFITGFVLISQNRQSVHANKRAELDYEVNVLTYRKIKEIDAAMAEIRQRLDALEVQGGNPRRQPEDNAE